MRNDGGGDGCIVCEERVRNGPVVGGSIGKWSKIIMVDGGG